MSGDWQEFWSTLPEKVRHPVRVLVVEALWWIDESLSARALVDILDGDITMWDAAHHLQALEELDVVEPSPVVTDGGPSRDDFFDAPYRLKNRKAGEGA